MPYAFIDIRCHFIFADDAIFHGFRLMPPFSLSAMPRYLPLFSRHFFRDFHFRSLIFRRFQLSRAASPLRHFDTPFSLILFFITILFSLRHIDVSYYAAIDFSLRLLLINIFADILLFHIFYAASLP